MKTTTTIENKRLGTKTTLVSNGTATAVQVSTTHDESNVYNTPINQLKNLFEGFGEVYDLQNII